MQIYLLLCRFGMPRSYLGKFLLISFLGVHVPLIGAVLYLLTMANIMSGVAIGVLVALVIATVIGSALTMLSLYALLAPVREASKAIKGYLREKKIPQLPTQINDEAGMLMANIQEGIIRLDAALDAAHSKLEETEESAKNKFGMLSAMSHELRTPLNHIIGFAEMMATEALGPIGQSRYRGYAENIGESGGDLLKSLQTILELSETAARSSELQPAAISLTGQIEGVQALVHLNAQSAGIGIRLDIMPGIYVRADARSFKQMLLHTLQGAIDTGVAGRPLSITAKQDGGTVTLNVVQYGRQWVADDVPQELSDTLDNLASYSGGVKSFSTHALRLSLVRSLVVANRGSISLHGGPDNARVVRIRMPAAAAVRTIADKAA